MPRPLLGTTRAGAATARGALAPALLPVSLMDERTSTPAEPVGEERSEWSQLRPLLEQAWEQHRCAVFATGHPSFPGPDPDDIESQLSWREAEPALRFGSTAARRYEPRRDWDEQLEHELASAWHEHGGMSWHRARPYVHYGWLLTRVPAH
jgi:hypothetical protein